ncbi:hypothetical protein [Archangium lansingense]|uniref:Uncharacterized protein n=1 Tax=Archangium lansingense TaxID=2995310 RepID=A0ABT4AD92_9BACT|nr:hypothetical protein [Archangium lansinium]MCY1078879.1 hypothetical protein [Archangium lansinium]
MLSKEERRGRQALRGHESCWSFATVDLGGLASGGRLQQFPGGPLPTLNLLKLD